MLAVGGVVAEVMTGQDTAKKKQAHLPGEGTAREGDASGGMVLGMGTAVRERHGKTQLVRIWKETEQQRRTHLLQCRWQWSNVRWVWHHCRGQRSSERDWPGHGKKMSLHRTLACLRGQDGTGLDTEKKKTWCGVQDWSGQIKK